MGGLERGLLSLLWMLSGHLVNGSVRAEAKKNEFSLILVILGSPETGAPGPVSCTVGKLVA